MTALATSATHGTDPLPLVRLDGGEQELRRQIVDAIAGVAARGEFTLGPEVAAFEAEFADYCGAAEAVGVSSGTDALALSLRAVGVGPGDEVVVPANGFIAAAEAVCIAGGRPRFADVDPITGNLTAELVEPMLRRRTRAVVPVHLYGRTADLEPLVQLARRARIAVVEDACQAHGAVYHGARAGSIGDCGCFSFYPSKNLGGWGDGGAVVTSDPEIADRVRLLRVHGERTRHDHVVIGTTARMHALQAAALRVKLRRLDDWNEARRRAAAALTAALEGTSVVAPAPHDPAEDHVYHLYVVRTSRRDALRRHLESCGVGTGIHYPVPMHRTEAFRTIAGRRASLPTCERLAATVCSLPISPWTTGDEVDRVAAAIHEHDDLTRQTAAPSC